MTVRSRPIKGCDFVSDVEYKYLRNQGLFRDERTTKQSTGVIYRDIRYKSVLSTFLIRFLLPSIRLCCTLHPPGPTGLVGHLKKKPGRATSTQTQKQWELQLTSPDCGCKGD
ncbi:hypothetical protein XELAEV_18028855mg [Xenopus laevis]|uniref:Uncharacterized protein n=1 Tax=Xenopus laevis TaxID=8355 RepID=A0A974CSB5_XENLA|nr:hypothetical protein XELAEV_18028855mg [Xenopus laevis]